MTLISLWMAMAMVPVAQSGDDCVRVAVVNVAVVSEQYQRTKDLEAQFEAKRQLLQQQGDALRQKIEQDERSLREELKPGTSAYEARQKEMAMHQAELQYFVETEGRGVERGLAGSLRNIFSDIQVAVREVAEQKGYDVVLSYDQLPQESPDNPTAARQQILLQKVVYWSPRVDLTNAVIRHLNTKYGGQGAASPGQREGDGQTRVASADRTETPEAVHAD